MELPIDQLGYCLPVDEYCFSPKKFQTALDRLLKKEQNKKKLRLRRVTHCLQFSETTPRGQVFGFAYIVVGELYVGPDLLLEGVSQHPPGSEGRIADLTRYYNNPLNDGFSPFEEID